MPFFKSLRREHPSSNPVVVAGPSTLTTSDRRIKTSTKAAVVPRSTSTTLTNVSQDTPALVCTTNSLLGRSKFRVLVVGKSGVGKSSLINAVFRVNLTRTSDDHATQHDIDKEFTSDDNDRLILHDSQGFVGGDLQNLRTVQDFIKKRCAEKEVKDRLHAIWLCCEIPVAGGRVFERGDEILLQDTSNNVPIIVVFTKYDLLVIQKKIVLSRTLGTEDTVHWERQAKEVVMKAVKESCEKPLKMVAGKRHAWTEVSIRSEYKDTIEKLIKLAMGSIVEVRTEAQIPIGEGAADSEQPNLGSWLFAVAQRGSLGTKLTTSIDVGRHKYWGYLFSGAFGDRPLDQCIGVIHDDIVNVWNFNDPNYQCLKSTEFRVLMIHMAKDLVSDRPNPPDLIETAMKIVGPAVGMATALPPSAPFVLPTAVGVVLASWLYGKYQRTPGTLRYLMGYVIDIIIIMGCLFVLIDSRGSDRMSPAMVNLVLKEYSPRKRNVHEQVKSYVNDTTLPALKPKRAIDRISELVKVDRYKELHKAVIAASKTLDDREKWITSDMI